MILDKISIQQQQCKDCIANSLNIRASMELIIILLILIIKCCFVYGHQQKAYTYYTVRIDNLLNQTLNDAPICLRFHCEISRFARITLLNNYSSNLLTPLKKMIKITFKTSFESQDFFKFCFYFTKLILCFNKHFCLLIKINN